MELTDNTFDSNRLEAVKRFAQTMIVVDDEASLQVDDEEVPQGVVRPSRRQARAAAEVDGGAREGGETDDSDRTHILDGKTLVDSALKHGLVCSVVRPGPEERAMDAVVQAARRVDIVCLDWRIHNDGGRTTVSLIKKIVQADQAGEGRLRLIVIYSAERARGRILDRIKREILSSVSRQESSRMALRKVEGRKIVSKVGLKIVFLVKAHDRDAPTRLLRDRVSEKDMPKQALREFADLCEGLLTSVAFGTVAAVRDATQEIVGSFGGEMDGPYFHHRSIITQPDEAEGYAVDTVLSSLRTAVRLRKVGRTFGSREAVERRIREMIANDAGLRLSFDRGQGAGEEGINFLMEDVVRLVTFGVDKTHDSITVGNKPSKGVVKRTLTSLFAGSISNSNDVMKRFAALTSTASHPGTVSVQTGEYVPSLGLGSVIVDSNGRYLLCIQASCDTVRITEPWPFLFVPLEVVEHGGDFVVPKTGNANQAEFVALRVEKMGYAKGVSVVFSPDTGTERVLAIKRGRPKKLRFKSRNGRTFEWIADLRHYQALNVAQRLGRDMSRLGFDEFEPFRMLKS